MTSFSVYVILICHLLPGFVPEPVRDAADAPADAAAEHAGYAPGLRCTDNGAPHGAIAIPPKKGQQQGQTNLFLYICIYIYIYII